VGKTEFIDPFVPINSTQYYYWIQSVGITGVSKPVRTEWNTMIAEVAEETPLSFRIAPPFPNPFNPGTNIQFDVPVASEVTLKVFNIQGQEVATLADRLFYAPGKYTLQFNASRLAAGVYFCRMTADSYCDVRRMVFMK